MTLKEFVKSYYGLQNFSVYSGDKNIQIDMKLFDFIRSFPSRKCRIVNNQSSVMKISAPKSASAMANDPQYRTPDKKPVYIPTGLLWKCTISLNDMPMTVIKSLHRKL